MSVVFPQNAYQANTIITNIENQWSLSGLLADSDNVNPDITNEGVHFLSHQQPEATTYRIAVIGRKISPLENVVSHPMFDEVHDTFEIWCHYTLESFDESTWENAESLVEQMEDEVLRILLLTYNPQTNTNVYFKTDRKWDNRDDFSKATKEINRVVTFSLIRLRSRTTAVAVGYGGVLVFSGSTSDGGYGSNYQFTEAYHVEIEEGYDTVEEVVSGVTPYAQGVPVHFTGKFSGIFQCVLFAKYGDIGTNAYNLNQIIKILTSGSYQGEIPRANFIQTAANLNSPANTMTDSAFVKITRFVRIYDQEQLVGLRIQGKLFRPSTITFQ